MVRLRLGFFAFLFLAVACDGGEPTPKPDAPAQAAGAQAVAAPTPADVMRPQDGGPHTEVSVYSAENPDQVPILEIRLWSRDGKPVPDIGYEVFWQTDDGPSVTNSLVNVEGWSRGGMIAGSRVHRVRIRPTGYSAPQTVQVNQFMQLGRIVRVDVLVLAAAVVSGVVLDESGAPVAKAKLAAFHSVRSAVDSEQRPAADTFGDTDEQGRFRLGGFPPGPFVLEAVTEQRVTVWRVTGTLTEGQEVSGVEILMELGHTVHGQVLDPNGVPVPNANVVAGKPARRQQTRPGPIATLTYVPTRQVVTATDEKGVFQLPQVPDSQEWAINVDHPRYRKSVSKILAGQVDVLVLLERGLEVTGEVTSSDGLPLAGATVSLLGGAEIPSATTLRTGRFMLGGLTEQVGRYLFLQHAKHAPTFLGPVSLQAGEALSIQLAAPARLGASLHTADGSPVAGARVILQYLDLPQGFPAAAYPADLLTRQSGLSSAEGEFFFDGIPAGRYRVEVIQLDGKRKSFEDLNTAEPSRKLTIE